ncbi:hypothetical protein HPB49_013009 [Dermacentor silvarum]|uniref:Uncharacterized protein n=1 Tax=Dermacentor silvarum TaxID=543639 RepID=A0ACB8C9H9_DERSI|nr:hypothetical protein HPB49_013009 [Dermacentor silvarum]
MQLQTILATAFLVRLASGLCERPRRLHNAGEFFSSSVFENGTTVDYVCDPGYDLLGIPRRTCHSNGTWLPTSLPFCVTDVAKDKTFRAPSLSTTIGKTNKTSRLTGEISGRNCFRFKRGRTHFWYVDLTALYQVQVLRIDFGNQTARSDSNCHGRRYRHESRRESHGAGKEPRMFRVRGNASLRYVGLTRPQELPICGFQVFADVAVPVAERAQPTRSPTVKRNESSAEDSWFGSYPFSKKVAVFVGIVAATAGVGFFVLCFLIFVARATCCRQRYDEAYLEVDAAAAYPTSSTGTEPERRRRHLTPSSTVSSEPTLLSVFARRSTKYSAKTDEVFIEAIANLMGPKPNCGLSAFLPCRPASNVRERHLEIAAVLIVELAS